MIRPAALAVLLLLVANTSLIQAQDKDTSQVSLPSDSAMQNLPRFGGTSVVLDIDTRIVENRTIVWNEKQQKTTIPGRPVEIKLVGENLVVVVRFTFIPNSRGGQNLLVAQGQVWVADQGEISYQVSVQTIPVGFDETIYYFPLGSFKPEDGGASIEVMLTLHPYENNN